MYTNTREASISMLFNSFSFAIFLPVVFCLYWILPEKYRWVILLASSYYFYMSWNARYVVLILATTLISYTCAVLMERAEHRGKKLILFYSTLSASLGILFFFKYFNFFTNSINSLFQGLTIPIHITTLRLLLPVGISFYTFQTISYVIDVYKGTIAAEHHFGKYAAFISFFPQLVAGPIERTSDLLPQIKRNHYFSYENASFGLKLMTWGFFKKLVIADNLSLYVDQIYRGGVFLRDYH